MLIVSTREFRANQSKYLGMAAEGEDIVLKSRRKGSFKLVPVTSDDALMSKKDFYAKIDHSLKQAQEGKIIKQNDGESMEAYLDRLLCTE